MALDLKNKKKRVPGQPPVEVGEMLTMGVTERILKNITELYESGLAGSGNQGSVGLTAIGNDPLLGLPLRKPRKKVSVMIIGNHSAGKSSFINWYVGETIQRTGVAIETKGFSFVTSGKRRDTLKGEATLTFYEDLAELGEFDGIQPNLCTEVCTSKEKNFPCVDFIDSPGLVDGDIHYPFDVDGAIVWLAQHVDLILVFFDPIGQALTKRTMDVIERLNKEHEEKLLFYMSKADQVENEGDRQRVLTQITQNVTARIKCTHAFKLPTFYLPGRVPPGGHPPPNALDDICEEIDKAMRLTVQKNLSTIRTDCSQVVQRIQQRQQEDAKSRTINSSRRLNGVLLLLGSYLVLLVIVLVGLRHLVAKFPPVGMAFTSLIERFPQVDFLQSLLGLASTEAVDEKQFYYTLGVLVVLYCSAIIASKIVWRPLPTLSKRELHQLKSFKSYVDGILKARDELYKEYFKQLQNND